MWPKFFDTHTHFNFNAFKEDSREAMERALAQDIWFINVASEAKTAERAVKIAEEFEQGVYASVGLHPIHTFEDEFEEEVKGEKVKFATRAEEFDRDFYAGLIERSGKVVAVGETGLDYFHLRNFSAEKQLELREKQRQVFAEQIELAAEKKLPLILHCRVLEGYDAYEDMFDILEKAKQKYAHLTGVLHCFAGDSAVMKKFLALDFYFGFNGIITFARDYDESLKAIPRERLLLETDSPWLAPIPHRGKRNESLYVPEVAKKMAELREEKSEEVARYTTENTLRLFGIKV